MRDFFQMMDLRFFQVGDKDAPWPFSSLDNSIPSDCLRHNVHDRDCVTSLAALLKCLDHVIQKHEAEKVLIHGPRLESLDRPSLVAPPYGPSPLRTATRLPQLILIEHSTMRHEKA